MTWDPWHLVLVRTPEGTTVPVRVWLPPLPGGPAVGPSPQAVPSRDTGGRRREDDSQAEAVRLAKTTMLAW